MSGIVFKFDANKVSMLDINELIDFGYRFKLVDTQAEDYVVEEDLDDIEEVLAEYSRRKENYGI